MKNFLKKNKKNLGILIIVTVIIGALYVCCENSRTIFNAIDTILAIPGLILSFIVLKVIDIKPENLDAYHRLRMMKDNEKKEEKYKAKKAFEGNLNEIKELNKKYYQFYNNKLHNIDVAISLKNQCSNGLQKLRDFVDETKSYIFKDFLSEINNLGELEGIDKVDVLIVNVDDELLFCDKLNKINRKLFEIDKLTEDDKKILEFLFDDTGLMKKYLNTCSHAYKEIQEEKDNEI